MRGNRSGKEMYSRKRERDAAIIKEGSEKRITLHKGRPVARQEVSQIDCSGPMNIKVTDRCHIILNNLVDIEC